MNKNFKHFINNTLEILESGEIKDYDKDKLLEVCKVHKALPLREKSWEELARYLNLNCPGDSLRQWAKREQVKEGSLPVKDLSGKWIESEKDIDYEIAKLYAERTKTRDVLNGYRKKIRDVARQEEFAANVVEAINNLPEIKLVEPKFDERMEYKEAILMLSDLHIGVECCNFYNTYNADIAAGRLSRLLSETVKYCELHSVEKLNIINLGDMIQGIIHPNARIQAQEDVISQVITASEVLAQFLNGVQEAAPYVTYRSCSDNHSRLSPNKEEAVSSENLSRIVDWFLEERLKDSNIEFIDDNLDYGLGMFQLNNGKYVCFAHGHEDKVNQSFQSLVGATGVFIDYILLGHYHNSKTKSFCGSKVIVNGSIVGTDEYALSKRLFSHPEQTLLIFDRDSLVNITVDLK